MANHILIPSEINVPCVNGNTINTNHTYSIGSMAYLLLSAKALSKNFEDRSSEISSVPFILPSICKLNR